MPFSAVHSDGDSESEGEGLAGQPAFSSVLTVMAGTVKHPVSLDQSRTSSTITRDETHTTQWPSHNSGHGAEMSSSSSYVADRIHRASSGLASNMSHHFRLLPCYHLSICYRMCPLWMEIVMSHHFHHRQYHLLHCLHQCCHQLHPIPLFYHPWCLCSLYHLPLSG